jgi:hypothetical protein
MKSPFKIIGAIIIGALTLAAVQSLWPSNAVDESSEQSEMRALLIDQVVCRNALGQSGWDQNPKFSGYVAEATKRGLTVDACRKMIGLPPVGTASIKYIDLLCQHLETLEQLNEFERIDGTSPAARQKRWHPFLWAQVEKGECLWTHERQPQWAFGTAVRIVNRSGDEVCIVHERSSEPEQCWWMTSRNVAE